MDRVTASKAAWEGREGIISKAHTKTTAPAIIGFISLSNML